MKALLLGLLFLAPPARADELTLHLYPTYLGLDWSTPASLARSALLNSLPDLLTKNGTSIGHVTVEVSCSRPERRVVTGMTQADLDESRRMLFGHGLGLGILFHDFKGKLEDRARIEERLAKRAGKGTSSFVTFRISPKACARLVRYFDEYEAKGYGARYGLPHRPLHREGAGCSAYGASFVKTAGLLSPELQTAWTKTIGVPLRLVGGPLTGARVSLWRLLLSRGSHWAREDEPSKSVFFYEPDTMHAWVLAKVKERGPGYEVKTLGRASGIIFDAVKTPVPSGPIWEAP